MQHNIIAEKLTKQS